MSSAENLRSDAVVPGKLSALRAPSAVAALLAGALVSGGATFAEETPAHVGPRVETGEDAKPAGLADDARMREVHAALEALKDGVAPEEYESAKLTLEALAAAQKRHEAGADMVVAATRRELDALVAELKGADGISAKRLRAGFDQASAAETAALAQQPSVVIVQQADAGGVRHNVDHPGLAERPQQLLIRLVSGAQAATDQRGLEFHGLRRPTMEEKTYGVDNGQVVSEGAEQVQHFKAASGREYDLHVAYEGGFVTAWLEWSERQNAVLNRTKRTAAQKMPFSQRAFSVRTDDGAAVTFAIDTLGWVDPSQSAPARTRNGTTRPDFGR